MKARNDTRRAINIGETCIKPGETVRLPDSTDLNNINQGLTLIDVKIKEKKGGK